MQGVVLFFLGNHKYFSCSYSFSLGAVWELITIGAKMITLHTFFQFNFPNYVTILHYRIGWN